MTSRMESLSMLSSLHDEVKSENCLEPHYKECYRIAIDALLEGGIDSYKDFLQKERATEFLAEDELNYITNHIQKSQESADNLQGDVTDDNSSSGTYWPLESDVEAPNLDLGWPYVAPSQVGTTDISLYFHPPRGHPFTIKEMIRRMIKEARQVIAIVMDMFTDVDILKELVEASSRGVPIYLLLDDINFPHFLKMTEKQGIQVQRLRNLRVRTVKGQDYLSKSGAKFSGKMDQKFLLVDCEKVMYGTYSFMWSYEKIHLSMVQIITGKLVESFDEEFRTIYARSCIPASFGPEELVSGKIKKIPWENGTYQYSMSSLLSASSQRSLFGRKEQIHALDSTYLKPRTRFLNNEDDTFSMRNSVYRPHQLGFNAQSKIQQFQQFERHDNWKRHSYAAGDKTELSPYMMLNRAMNNRGNNAPNTWNRQVDVASIGSSSRGGYSSNYDGSTQSFATRLTQRMVPNLSERNVRRSFHGADSHIRSVQQRMPTLERTTKSFLRNWRIESYLNDHSDIPPDSTDAFSERNEASEATESITDNSLYSNSRLRSSLLYQPALPEQMEASSCTTGSSHSNSTIVDSQGSLTPKASPSAHNRRFSDNMDQYNFINYENQHTTHQDTLKRHSLHVPESSRLGSNYTSNIGQTSYLYTGLCANNQTDPTNKQNDNFLKRRSLPLFERRKVNGGQQNTIVPPNYIYNSLVRGKPETTLHQNTSNFTSTPNLETNLQHIDTNTNSKSQTSLVTQAISTESLDTTSQEDHNGHSPTKKESKGSPNFLKKGSQKLKSLLNLAPEKKENMSKNKTPAFYRMCSSSDTLISEGDEQGSPKKSDSKNEISPKKDKLKLSASQFSLHKSKESICTVPPKSPKLISEEVNKVTQTPDTITTEKTGDASTPRFNTEPIQYQDTRTYATYGRVMPTSVQRDPSWNAQTEVLPREMPQHIEMPPVMQREMHLRHSQHRGVQQIDMQQRDMYAQHIPQEEINPARVNERRVYSRFEPFCKLENTMPAHNSNVQISDYQSKGMMNTYNRPNNMLSYNSPVYNSVQPNENRFGRFMQKFGSFIHKKQ